MHFSVLLSPPSIIALGFWDEVLVFAPAPPAWAGQDLTGGDTRPIRGVLDNALLYAWNLTCGGRPAPARAWLPAEGLHYDAELGNVFHLAHVECGPRQLEIMEGRRESGSVWHSSVQGS